MQYLKIGIFIPFQMRKKAGKLFSPCATDKASLPYYLLLRTVWNTTLIVVLLYFKISLWMQASRTDFRSCSTYIQVTAVTALPYSFHILHKYLSFFDVLCQSQVSFFVTFSATAISRYILAIAGKPSSSAMSANFG